MLLLKWIAFRVITYRCGIYMCRRAFCSGSKYTLYYYNKGRTRRFLYCHYHGVKCAYPECGPRGMPPSGREAWRRSTPTTATMKMATQSTPIGRHYTPVPPRARSLQHYSCGSSLLAEMSPPHTIHAHTDPADPTSARALLYTLLPSPSRRTLLLPTTTTTTRLAIAPRRRGQTLWNLMNLTLDLAIINPRFN